MGTDVRSIVVGISGVSSSGKTTLARLLRDIYPNTSILHEDDFYWPDTQIPVKNGVQDWDCLEALDLEKFQRTLQFIKTHALLPPDLDSKEDKNSVGECNVDENLVGRLKSSASQMCSSGSRMRIFIVEGFLLYARPMKEVWKLMDARFFLRTSHVIAKQRREARAGYVTIDGFWEDPPGYVDNVVWPNYVKDHAFLFVEGDVEGEYDDVVCNSMALQTMPADAEGDMTKCLSWAFAQLENVILAQRDSNQESKS